MRLDRIDFTWLFLLAATATTWFIGESGAAGVGAMLAMLAIAFAKGRLVALDFMGLRRVSLLWRGLLIGWLVLVVSLIALAYRIGLSN